MNIHDARHLTDLFNRRAAHRSINLKEMSISMDTLQGTHLKVNVKCPQDAALYLQQFRDTKNPLFQRGVQKLGSSEMPEPIAFKICGFFVDPETSFTWWAVLARFRFAENNKPSQLHFDHDFARTDWNVAQGPARIGPSLNDMINILLRAENKWEQVNFLPKRKEVLRSMHLVPPTS